MGGWNKQRWQNAIDVVAVMHTHPFEKGMDGEHFSVPDKEQADQLQRDNPNKTITSYLLTPDNKVMIYIPKESKEHPNGEEVGFFSKKGDLIVTNKKFSNFAQQH
jgi:hypothetical protein